MPKATHQQLKEAPLQIMVKYRGRKIIACFDDPDLQPTDALEIVYSVFARCENDPDLVEFYLNKLASHFNLPIYKEFESSPKATFNSTPKPSDN